MRAALPLLLAVFALPSLRAQSVNVGATFTVAKPVSDLNAGAWIKGRGAEGLGLRLPLHLWRNHTLVPRADLLNVRPGVVNVLPSDQGPTLYQEFARVQLRSAGVDYNYYVSDSLEDGFYWGVGLAYSEARFTQGRLLPGDSAAQVPDGAWRTEQTKKALQYAVVTGWKFSAALGLEFRFTQANYKGIGVPGTVVKAPVLALSLTLEY